MPSGYVVYTCESLRDENIEYGKCFAELEHAVDYINKLAGDSFFGHNTSFRLFELGKEIKLESADVKTPQPDVVQKQFKVK